MRNQSLIRQWQLLKLLAKKPATPQELSSHFTESPRTIYRDIEALKKVGFPIKTTRVEAGSFYYLDIKLLKLILDD
ncbi:MAG: helix-turn-helix domain-containing protein [Deltaproteobacteria bacterium]|nr:helix-turn-helix domain-containing protein [Deltaproteobacteria bacterium]